MAHILFNRRKYYKNLSILIPLVAIIVVVLYLLMEGFKGQNVLIFNIVHSIIMTAGIWLGCTIIVSYMWVKVPWEHSPLKRLLIEVPAIIVYTMIFSGSLFYMEYKMGYHNLESIDFGKEIFITLLITLLVTSIHESVFFYKQWKYNFSRSVRLQKDSIEAKYESLKTQINPHFLFNSLNSLTNIVADNEKAIAYISDLSDFLRYILRSKEKELVLVRDEIKMLAKYIALQKSRFGTNLIIKNIVSESKYHYSMPPLVLQMLFENCIKHNIISQEKPLTVSIYNDDEYIYVKNKIQIKTGVTSTGHGLNNITERYRYFSDREVKIEQKEEHFIVRVPLLIIEE